MLLWVAVILVGIAVFIVMNVIFTEEDQYKLSETIEDAAKVDTYANDGIILKYSRPFFRRYVTPIVSGLKGKQKIRNKYKRKLASAGLTQSLTPDEFFSFKIFLIVGFPIVFLFLRWFLEETWPLTMVPLVAIGGFFYPDIWIKGQIEARQKEIVMRMPFLVDLLALSVEAGLDTQAAMTKVVEKSPKSALTDEFEILLKEVKIGASRAEALRNMSWRVDLIQISSFCATLIAADSVGANIGPILKALSEEIRQKRSSEVEKQGAKAATKILFPMMGFIVPAVFIVIATPLILEWLAGKG